MFGRRLSGCAALIILVSVSYSISNATSFLISPFTINKGYAKKSLAYVLSDSKFSQQAVSDVMKVTDSVVATKLQLVNLNETNGTGSNNFCQFIRESPVVHLTSACLPKYVSRLRTPVLSVPTLHGEPLAHVSFMEGEINSSEFSVLLDVARMMNWKSAVYLGDTDTVLLDQLLHCNGSFHLSDVVSVNKEINAIRLYATIGQSRVDFVLVHCHSYRCYKIVTKLFYLRNEESIGDSRVPWLMTNSLTQNARSTVSSGPLVVYSTTYGIQKAIPIGPQSGTLLGEVWSLRQSYDQCSSLVHCPVTLQQQLEVLSFYDSLTVLFALVKDNQWENFKGSGALVHFINKANLNGISRPIRFDHHASERKQPVLYNVLDISPSVVAKIGVYDNSESLWLHEPKPLNGQATKRGRTKREIRKCAPAVGTFRVTTMIEPPFVIHDPNNTIPEDHNGPFTGFVVDIMEWLSTELKFSYTMSLPPDLKYGSVNDSGVGTGMVGQLMNCEADIAAAAFAVTSLRSMYIHFTEPYIDAGKALLVYKGSQPPQSIWSFLKPFDTQTKGTAVACFFVASIVLSLLHKFSLRSKTKEPEDETESPRKCKIECLGYGFWYLYTTFMQRGADTDPSLGGAILISGWLFFALVIIATYTANLAAFLTVRSFKDGIQSLDDLAGQTEIVYGTVKDTSITEFFETSPLDIHKRVYNYMNNVDGALVDTAQEAYDRVHYRTKGDYIFIWDQPILDYVASHEPCKSRVVGRPFVPQGYAFALPKRMPYEFNFTLAILKMRESGMIDSLRNKWMTSGPCPTSISMKDVTGAEEIHLSDIFGIFVALAITVGVAIIVGIVEELWRRKRLKTQAKKNGTTETHHIEETSRQGNFVIRDNPVSQHNQENHAISNQTDTKVLSSSSALY